MGGKSRSKKEKIAPSERKLPTQREVKWRNLKSFEIIVKNFNTNRIRIEIARGNRK